MKIDWLSHYEFLMKFGCVKCGKKIPLGSYSSALALYCPYCGQCYEAYSKIILSGPSAHVKKETSSINQVTEPLDPKFYHKLTNVYHALSELSGHVNRACRRVHGWEEKLDQMKTRIENFIRSERFKRILEYADKSEREKAREYSKNILDDTVQLQFDMPNVIEKAVPDFYHIPDSIRGRVEELCDELNEATESGYLHREFMRAKQVQETAEEFFQILAERRKQMKEEMKKHAKRKPGARSRHHQDPKVAVR